MEQKKAIRKKMTLEPGHSYRGWAAINEYGEVSFTATQPGTATDSALRKQTGESREAFSYTISTSKDKCCVRLTVLKGDVERMEDALREVFDLAIEKVGVYAI